MKRIACILLLLTMVFSSCNWRRIKGNGNLATENRSITNVQKIILENGCDVEITQGPVASLKVEADDNLIPYIITREEGITLRITSKNHTSLSSDNPIKVYITTTKLEQIQLTGSGNIIGKTKFTGSDKLTLKISGSGDINLDVNAPRVDGNITGSGTIAVTGETKDEDIHIVGAGNYNADGLKAENAVVRITGAGDVKVFTDNNLDVNITGVGSVLYKGNATLKQRVTGSGDVRKLE